MDTTTLFISICSFLLAAIATPVIEKLLEPYISDREKLKKNLWAFLLFNLRYTQVVFFLIRDYYTTETVTKNYVLSTALYIGALAVNISFEFSSSILRIMKDHIAMTRRTNESIGGILDIIKGKDEIQKIKDAKNEQH